jgi:hypothetical protein
MASTFVGFNRGVSGLKLSDYTIGSSTGSTDMEVRFDNTKNLTQLSHCGAI